MAADARVPELTVYSRAYCHLCDDMIAGLRSLQVRFHFDVTIVDVDGDPRLEALYDEHVPVLTHGAIELCRHRLDIPLVTDYLAKVR